MRQIIVFVCLVLLIYNTSAYNLAIDLGGVWYFSSSNGSINGTGTVPGDIYSDLYAEGIIDNPLFGENHLDLKWIAADDWTYSKTFRVTEVEDTVGVFLDLESIDTIATVFLNGHKVLHARNQFLAYHVNVTDVVKNGENEIVVKFKSPVLYSEKKAESYERLYGHRLPPDCNPGIYHGECHQNFIRKAQYSYSWDWGPSFPTVGISRSISLNTYKGQYLHDFSWNTKYQNGKWHVEFTFDIFHYGARTVECIVTIPELSIKESDIFLLSATRSLQSRSRNKLRFSIPLAKEPERWWPNGMGEPKLYEVKVAMGDQVKQKKIGFKTVELVQTLIDEKMPKKGRNFYFKVNNEPVFLKGTNWIPVSMFPANETNVARMKFLLDSAVEVGMNAIRVWGGGFYETKEFYDYTAEKGILVWQDLMFACALYPTTAEFIKNTEEEVTYQVDRISQWPSILVFSGNNENEAAIRGHWWKSTGYSEYQQVKDYKLLYKRLGNIVKKKVPSIPFIMSSPSNGVETEEEGGVAINPYDVRYGDIHYYNEFVNLWRDDTYLTPRCASEYGVQSYPLRDTMLKWINDTDWEYTSKAMFHRQHHPGGIATNLLMVFQHLPIPSECESKSFADIHRCEYVTSGSFMSRFAYLSQIHQSIALKTQTLHYRRFRNITTDDGLGNTMCAMYWQLNDVWAAPTWSTIDFEQKWKMAHYEAKRFFANVAVYSFPDEIEFNLDVYLLNDNNYVMKNMTVMISMLSWTNGLDPIQNSEFHVELAAGSSRVLNTGLKFSKVKDLSEFVYVTSLYTVDGVKIYEDVLIPDFLFEVNFSLFGDVKVHGVQRIDELTYEVTVTTNQISPFTWLDVKKPFVGWFSDNGFHMIEMERKIRLHTKTAVDLDQSDFTVCNLKNCYLE